jgi:hypothetical protein
LQPSSANVIMHDWSSEPPVNRFQVAGGDQALKANVLSSQVPAFSSASLPHGRGVVVYFKPNQLPPTYPAQLAALIAKIPNVKYVYLDGFELTQDPAFTPTFGEVGNNGAPATARYHKKNITDYQCDLDPNKPIKNCKVYSECRVKINTPKQDVIKQYQAIISQLHQQSLKVLLMSSFMPLGPKCNFLQVSNPAADASQLVNMAATIGADGVAVDYEPVSVNRGFHDVYSPEPGAPGVLKYNDFAKLYFDNQQKNTLPYFQALRDDVIGSQQLNNGAGLFAIVAGKNGFYGDVYDGSQWQLQSTFMIKNVLNNNCQGRCFASVMFYDTTYKGESDSLYSLIGSMTTGFNSDAAGLPSVLKNVPFRLMLPLAYSEDSYYNPQVDDAQYSYSAFLCDISSIMAIKWLGNPPLYPAAQCDSSPTYLPGLSTVPGLSGQKRPLLKQTQIKSQWSATLASQFSLFGGVDFYRIVTKNYDSSGRYLCDTTSSPSGLFACQSKLNSQPTVQDVQNEFIP